MWSKSFPFAARQVAIPGCVSYIIYVSFQRVVSVLLLFNRKLFLVFISIYCLGLLHWQPATETRPERCIQQCNAEECNRMPWALWNRMSLQYFGFFAKQSFEGGTIKEKLNIDIHEIEVFVLCFNLNTFPFGLYKYYIVLLFIKFTFPNATRTPWK